MSFSGSAHASAFPEPAGPSGLDASDHRPAAVREGIDLDALRRIFCEIGQVEDLDELGQGGPLLASAGASSLFHSVFGRDAIRMAFDLLEDFPCVAETTLLTLASLQGVRHDPRAEEQPGRIIHEDRLPDDFLRPELERFWSFPYYGAVDSTPQWVNLLAAYTARAGDAILDTMLVDRLGRQITLFDSLLAALGWIVDRLDDPAAGGYLSVRRASLDGIANQVWEDSGDSHYHADGTVFDFTQPYAPVAVQGYAYDALLGAAEILARRHARSQETADRLVPGSPELARERRQERDGGGPEHGQRPETLNPACWAAGAERRTIHDSELRERAADLRARVLDEFWQPDLGTFAMALTFDGPGDGSGSAVARRRPARVVASSPGHLLASRLLDGDDVAGLRARLVRRLFEADLLAGAGIRTRATGAARFRAGSYHNGSTWPVDTGVIADGLRRHGHDRLADTLEGRILAGCAAIGGFPEFFRGDEDGRIAVNTTTIDELVDGALNRLEQPPQTNQGWTATRVWRILRRSQACPEESRACEGGKRAYGRQ